jgi:hypothetical protein
VNSWADVEEAVAAALWDFAGCGWELTPDECRQLARVAIVKIQELRLTAVVPGA